MTVIRRLNATNPQFDTQLRALLAYEDEQDASIEAVCRDIIHDIRQNGDAALLRYTQRFDALEVEDIAALEITAETLQAAQNNLPAAQRIALETRSEEHTSELQSRGHLVCRLLLEKKNTKTTKPK